jgi:hypothetical protein
VQSERARRQPNGEWRLVVGRRFLKPGVSWIMEVPAELRHLIS